MTAERPRAEVPANVRWVGDSERLRLLARAPAPGIYDVVEYVWRAPPEEDALETLFDGSRSGIQVPLEEGLDERGDAFHRDSDGLMRRSTRLFPEESDRDGSNGNTTGRGLRDREPASSVRGQERINGETEAERSTDSDPVREDSAPEIRRLRFRYFDGAAWHSAWDSGASGRLPIAIEIAFDVDVAAAVRASLEDSDEIRLSETASSTREGERRSARPDDRLGSSFKDKTRVSDAIGTGDETDEDAYEYRFVIAVDTASARSAAAGEAAR